MYIIMMMIIVCYMNIITMMINIYIYRYMQRAVMYELKGKDGGEKALTLIDFSVVCVCMVYNYRSIDRSIVRSPGGGGGGGFRA